MLPAPWKQHVEWLPPKPGCTIKVIGGGQPRTGTNSFCAAVSHLLDGPAYHAGVQTVATGDPSHTRTWISVLKPRPYTSDQARKDALNKMKRELDGYVLTIDAPLPGLVPELLELYPEAVVIVTMRDKKSWSVSFSHIIKLVNVDLLEMLFFWIRNLREVPTLWRLFGEVHFQQHGYTMVADEAVLSKAWDDHIEWLREIVPKEKLFFYDVRDGWEPLCKILNKPVPDIPFPRLNDAKAMDDAFRSWSIQGLMMWLLVLVAAAVLGASCARYYYS